MFNLDIIRLRWRKDCRDYICVYQCMWGWGPLIYYYILDKVILYANILMINKK